MLRTPTTMSLVAGRNRDTMDMQAGESSSIVPQGGAGTSSSRKRKSPHAASPSINVTEQPLVPATEEGLREMRRRVATVVEETMRNRLAGTKEKGSTSGTSGNGAIVEQQDATTTAYLRAFQAAVMSKVASMCDVQDSREQREADDLLKEITQFGEDMQAARARLQATRERVAQLSAATCNDSLRVAEAADDRACEVLRARAEHAKNEREAGGPLPPEGQGATAGSATDDYDPADVVTGAAGAGGFSGIDANFLEPKVSLLIGKLSELPGPLKAVLQEIPELTASLAKTVQSVEAAMGAGESRTEALLAKAPPTPLARGKAGGGRPAGGEQRHPPEEVRAMARDTRAERARKDWQAAGGGALGGFFG